MEGCDKMLDSNTLERLYGPPQDGWLPYRLFAWGGESYSMKVMHFPGNEPNTVDITTAFEAPYHGYRGLLVQDYAKSFNNQRVKLMWCAVDVDAKDNPGKTVVELFDRAYEALKYFQYRSALVFRTSKSGQGLHVIAKLSGAECSYAEAMETSKIKAGQMVRALIAADVLTCVYGLPNLWLWSKDGLQRNLN